VVSGLSGRGFGPENAESWALTVTRPIRVVGRVLSPPITLFDGVTRRISGVLSADDGIERIYADRAGAPAASRRPGCGLRRTGFLQRADE
jgi:CBS domain containing-hemolysin-like protein